MSSCVFSPFIQKMSESQKKFMKYEKQSSKMMSFLHNKHATHTFRFFSRLFYALTLAVDIEESFESE